MPWAARDLRRALWGLILLGCGVALLLDRIGVLQIRLGGQWWPAILVLIGAIRMLTPARPGEIAEGLTFALLGLWFFACHEHWLGLGYGKGWPLLLVIFGAEMVLGAALDRIDRSGEDGRDAC